MPSRFLQQVFAEHGIPAQIIPNIIDRETVPRSGCASRCSHGCFPPATSNRSTTSRARCERFGIIQRRYPDCHADARRRRVPRSASLRRLAAELGLRGVTFAGRVAPEDIRQYYAAADIYVQTPTIDNMPSSILEAFASGLPVVSTEAGGVPAMLTDEVHGLLAPVGDAGQVAAQVISAPRGPGARTDRLTLAARESTDALVWEHVRDRWVARLPRSCAPHPFSSRGPGRYELDAPAGGGSPRWTAESSGFGPSAAGRRQAGRVAYVARPPQWRRDALARALAADDPSTRPAIARLQRGDWMGAHEALMHHFATRPARFVLHPAVRSQRVRTRPRRIIPGAARRCDPTRRSGGRGTVRSARLQGPDVWQRRASANGSIGTSILCTSGARHTAYWSRVPYLEPSCGDHKVVWELNRHQSWLTARTGVLADGRRALSRRLHRAPR